MLEQEEVKQNTSTLFAIYVHQVFKSKIFLLAFIIIIIIYGKYYKITSLSFIFIFFICSISQNLVNF